MRAHQSDYFLVSIIFFLVIFGLIVLSSASVVLSQNESNQSYLFLKHQLIYGFGLGLIGFLISQRIHYGYWKKFAFPLIILGLVLLFLVFIPQLGYEHSGANRWIKVGNFSLQPFEFVKLFFIIYLSALLSKKEKKDQVIKESLIPVSIILGAIILLLYFQPNMSAIGIIVILCGFIYFLAGMKISYILTATSIALIGFFTLIKTASYRMNRLNVFLHPELDPQGIGYQINQALLAIGSGGLFGLGLGHSIQKWRYLPEPIGDSIFAIIAEELGLIGAGILVILFILLAWRGIQIAKNAPDKFGFLLASGITSWFFFQSFINMAAISGLMPLTGMPLPFISYGGSAMVASLIGAGVLINISKYTK